MQATSRLRPGLPVRVLPDRPNMPELQGHPFALRRGRVGVAVILAFIRQSSWSVIAASCSRVPSPIGSDLVIRCGAGLGRPQCHAVDEPIAQHEGMKQDRTHVGGEGQKEQEREN